VPDDPPVFYGLTESEHRTDDQMLSKCVELASIVDAWISNIIPEAQCVLLHQFNMRQQEKHLSRIQLFNPPMLSGSGDATQLFSYADAELGKRTSGGRKTVFLGECPKVQAALQRVPEEWGSADDILKLPEVTALYYVLGAMFRLPYEFEDEDEEPEWTGHQGRSEIGGY
jgi:hypothetical protein